MSVPNLRRFSHIVSPASLVLAAFVVLFAAFGMDPIRDNSLLTHVQTGRLMLSNDAVPIADPYSYTALGAQWIVQSWLVSLMYGLLDGAIGPFGIVLFHAVVAGCLALASLRLASNELTQDSRLRTRSERRSAAPIAAAVTLPFVVLLVNLPTRPMLVALFAFALCLLILSESQLTSWQSRIAYVAVLWIWINSHASYSLFVLWLAATTVGALLDQWQDRRNVGRRFALYWCATLVGLVLGAINPLGVKLELFAVRMTLGERARFDSILEWQSPSLSGGMQLVAWTAVVALITVAVWQKTTWRIGIPTVIFFVLALLFRRNLAFFAVVMVPLGAQLVARLGAKMTQKTTQWSKVIPLTHFVRQGLAISFLLSGAIALVIAMVSPHERLQPYPQTAVNFMQKQGLLENTHRIVHREYVGNYLIYATRGKTNVFIDDRADMYPAKVENDYQALLKGSSPLLPILDRYNADVVLWESATPLAYALAQDKDNWRLVFEEGSWQVFQRNGTYQ